MGTRANEASRAAAEPLLQAYDAALSDDSSKTQRLGQLLRCALFLSDPACCFAAGDLDGHGERAGQEGASSCGGEEEWASSCAAMRGHVDNALRMHMRSVISDTESVSVISEYTSSAGVNAAEAPMFDEDITAWGEFQAMRDVILQFENQIPENSMQITFTASTSPVIGNAGITVEDRGHGRRPARARAEESGMNGFLHDVGPASNRLSDEQGFCGARGVRPSQLDGGHDSGGRQGENGLGGGHCKRQRVWGNDDLQSSPDLEGHASTGWQGHGGRGQHSNLDSGFAQPEGRGRGGWGPTAARAGQKVGMDARGMIAPYSEGLRPQGGGGSWPVGVGKIGGGAEDDLNADVRGGMHVACDGRELERERACGRAGWERNDFVTGSVKFRQDLAEKNCGRGGGRAGDRGSWGFRASAGGSGVDDWKQGSHYSAAPTGAKTLGVKRYAGSGGFKCPWRKKEEQEESASGQGTGGGVKKIINSLGGGGGSAAADGPESEVPTDPRYKNIDPKMIEMIENEIVDSSPGISWDDIAGLDFAKSSVQEIVVWPMLRPDLFTGLRGPPKGLLLFGPPGTGKTLIGKTIATESNATFFSISASSLMSKWVGEGERMVRALFAVARVQSPSVIFIDEIDSLLSQRGGEEGEASRRVKTEFLVQMDGVGGSKEERLLLIGATNRPQELDEAARRRMIKRLYIPLPDLPARVELITRLLSKEDHSLDSEQVTEIAMEAAGYSGADCKALCAEASLGPIREIRDIRKVSAAGVRPICYQDFKNALRQVRASVGTQDIAGYLEWNRQFGSFPVEEACGGEGVAAGQ